MTAPGTLQELFRRGRPADADTVLLEVPGGERVTYGQADRRSAQLAHALVAAGVGTGDRVAAQVAKSPDAVLLYLACVRVGAALLPMNPAYTADEVAHLVADAEPAVVLDDAGLVALVAGARSQPDRFDDVDVGPDDLAALLYTSGTTGRPKGAMLSHRNLASNAAVLHDLWGFGPDDVLLHGLPIFHVHGLFVAINCVLANGTGMVFLPRFDVDDVLAALPRCTVLMGVPTHYTRLLDDPRFDAEVCVGMRLFVSGSAPLLASTHEAFQARTGHVILERYGMTETSMLTSNPLVGERRPGTVGFPLPGTDVRIADDETIEVRGPNVFAGYWRRPELAATEFTADGWFRTGDLGAFDDDGHLRIVGRAKDLVISGGLNVYPKEVEDVVDAIDGVLECAVVGVPDVDLGEAVLAVVVPEAGRTLDPDTVRAVARRRLAGFKVPKRVEVVDALPRNAMGKVTKAELRRRFGS
ncbi:MAG: malonyl-CoA synthase [Actinomycetia bacterium]|nr:malonyl-CoA synthase [Actinomycetes bacterium]